MHRNRALAVLRDRFGVLRLGIFGSVARDEATDDSDIDIVVKMPPDLYLMVHVKEQLEEALRVPVESCPLQRTDERFFEKTH